MVLRATVTDPAGPCRRPNSRGALGLGAIALLRFARLPLDGVRMADPLNSQVAQRRGKSEEFDGCDTT